MLLSFASAVTSLVLFFLWEIFTANAASPLVDTEPATINPKVDKQNGHMVHLSGSEASTLTACIRVTSQVARFLQPNLQNRDYPERVGADG
jgi:hypothetical protein